MSRSGTSWRGPSPTGYWAAVGAPGALHGGYATRRRNQENHHCIRTVIRHPPFVTLRLVTTLIRHPPIHYSASTAWALYPCFIRNTSGIVSSLIIPYINEIPKHLKKMITQPGGGGGLCRAELWYTMST